MPRAMISHIVRGADPGPLLVGPGVVGAFAWARIDMVSAGRPRRRFVLAPGRVPPDLGNRRVSGMQIQKLSNRLQRRIPGHGIVERGAQPGMPPLRDGCAPSSHLWTPPSRQGKTSGSLSAWSDAVICPALDAAGRQ